MRWSDGVGGGPVGWRPWNVHRSLLAVSVLVGLASLTLSSAIGLFSDLAETAQDTRPRAPRTAAVTPQNEVRLNQGEWHERVRQSWFWSDRGPASGSSGAWLDRSGDERSSNQSAYRTLCVRLCDGYYWPISYGTTRERFARDERACKASCGTPARLFLHRNSDGDVEDMEDLAGQPYTRLKTAFLFRKAYDKSCKCTAHPWETEARTRHRLYALDAARRKGDTSAAEEFAALQVLTGVKLPVANAIAQSPNVQQISESDDDKAPKMVQLGSEPSPSRQAHPSTPLSTRGSDWQNEAFRKQ